MIWNQWKRPLTVLVSCLAISSVTPLVHGSIDVGGIEQAGGVIKGIVKFEGKQVRRRKVRMAADPVCQSAHKKNPPLKEKFVFGDNGTLQNVFVYISKGLEGKKFPLPTQPAHINQEGCVYVPHVLGIVVGQTLRITNDDSTLHNVKCSAKTNRSFNEGMPVKGMKIDKVFNMPEMKIPLRCDVHPWMNAYVHVMPHPFFAVTQKAGTFEIRGLPAGTYEISVLHEFKKFKPVKKTLTVEVKVGATSNVIFNYRPPHKR